MSFIVIRVVRSEAGFSLDHFRAPSYSASNSAGKADSVAAPQRVGTTSGARGRTPGPLELGLLRLIQPRFEPGDKPGTRVHEEEPFGSDRLDSPSSGSIPAFARRGRVTLMALPGTSWHYRTEPSIPNSEVTSVGYRIPGTASEAGGRAFAAKRSFASARQRSCPANRARVTISAPAMQCDRRRLVHPF
jgi:hypothetical protein